MKNSWIPAIAVAFIAGLLTLLSLQLFGWVQVTGRANPPPLLSELTNEQKAGTRKPETESDWSTVADLQATVTRLQEDIYTAQVERDEIRSQFEILLESQAEQEIDERFLPGTTTSDDAITSDTTRDRRGRSANNNSQDQYAELVAAGVDPSVASEIKQAADQWALSRLNLIDNATRDGWRGTDRFADEIQLLRDQQVDIRTEIGDGAYDAYLFAAGRNNRIRIESIIDGSAAQLAGVEAGDIVLSYAESSVYTTRELQNATRDGVRSETIPIVIQRDGQTYDLLIPRGPLGVTLSGLRSATDQ